MTTVGIEETRVFFPLLIRQGEYPRKIDGSNYDYTHYREHIATDCQRRCVYCDVKEEEVGGAEAMQLDHFRPGSFQEYEHLINDPLNLHYGCGRCNLLKANKWPARGTPHTHDGVHGFLDPFVEDRLRYFAVGSDGQIEALQPPAPYIIRLLHLRREFLRKLRQKRLLMAEFLDQLAAYRSKLQGELNAGRPSDPREALAILDRIELLLRS